MSREHRRDPLAVPAGLFYSPYPITLLIEKASTDRSAEAPDERTDYSCRRLWSSGARIEKISASTATAALTSTTQVTHGDTTPGGPAGPGGPGGPGWPGMTPGSFANAAAEVRTRMDIETSRINVLL